MIYQKLKEFYEGQSVQAYDLFGAHFVQKDGIEGIEFTVYAPHAFEVEVIGDFNQWIGTNHKMKKIDLWGVYSIFVPYLHEYENYKYRIITPDLKVYDKLDPYAFYTTKRPNLISRTFQMEGFPWTDANYQKSLHLDEPLNIYELHFGSWKKKNEEEDFSYEEMSEEIISYVKNNHFTHIEIMPLTEYPLDGSWGYLSCGYFSATSRYGNPKQLMHFINRAHQENIGIILDFVLVHFTKDSYGLIHFDGQSVYEYPDSSLRVSQWGSINFDLGKDPVRSFLMSAVHFWIHYFHVDGIRFDAVSNLIFYDGDSTRGVNQGATEFIKRLNKKIKELHPQVMLIAEDSSNYNGVTKSVEHGGLGFDYKWDLGWMNDSLSYYQLDPIYRKFNHEKITFSMHYFHNERFILSLSHDEVVHGKKTILDKMWGKYEQKFAQAKNLYLFMMTHPGKKLNFMGNEFGHFAEWNEKISLDWFLLKYPSHQMFQLYFQDLNQIYRKYPSLWKWDYQKNGFEWLIVNNRDQSIFSYKRVYKEEEMVILLNMTPIYYKSYDLFGLSGQCYEEVINNDDVKYNGYGAINSQQIQCNDGKLTLCVAPFASILLRKVK